MNRRVDIKVGFKCNNCCRFCVQGNKRDFCEDKTFEELKEILKSSRKNHNSVVFTGGEPTLKDDLPDLVEYAKKLNFKKIQIQSNGRRFAYKDYCSELIRKGANEFALALHGPNEEIHDKLTNTKGSFRQTVQGVKNLVDLNQLVLINSVINKINYKYLPEMADLFIKLKVNHFQFAFIHINEIIKNDPKLIEELVPRKSDVIPYVKEGLEKGIKAGIRVATEAIPICFLEEHKEYISELGRIPDGSIYDAERVIKNYEEHRRSEAKKKAEKCKKCKYYDVCEGPWREYPEIFGWEEFKPIIE